ncbi:MAG: asparagine synthase (glutamine-hydrolyzing) [Gammaproteobacteria bacterium]
MCGIAGFIQPGLNLQAVVSAMTDRLQHRGPDARGVWCDQQTGVALGHRRLSILDLSEAGSQPMHSASGRFVISYNGEIYNFRDLAKQLGQLGCSFRGHSDTEVLLAAIEQWGIDAALLRINGMFAFALWDRSERRLVLARDRVGKKPLYYGWSNDCLLFGSELKALRAHPRFDHRIDRDALGQYVRFGWVPEPLSIYKSLRKLAPGSLVRIPLDSTPWSVEPEVYWHAARVCENARHNAFSGDYEQAVGQLDQLLGRAVGERMVADVDLGALLSGGVDSTTVVALMQRQSERPVKTFSIGFDEPKFNEAGYAAAIARHLGTDHHELYVTPQQCLDVVEHLSEVYDEPFADISQVPTLLVAQMARQGVTVVLSGDGGDELFGGYNHYFEALLQWRRMRMYPQIARVLMRRTVRELAAFNWKLLAGKSPVHKKLPAWKRQLAKLEKRSRGWDADSPQLLLLERFARYEYPAQLVPGSRDTGIDMADPDQWIATGDPLLKMRQLDFIGYLPGDILVKVDRATMSVGLEARCPILDTRVTEFAWSLPYDFLVDARGGKKILRSVMDRYVPDRLTDRPKRGFGAPVEDWLRGPLRDWAESLLDSTRLQRQGLFQAQAVSEIWNQHLSGWHNHANLLWALLMFQTWIDAGGGGNLE